MNQSLEAAKTKTRKSFAMQSGALMRRDQETSRPSTKGKSAGSGGGKDSGKGNVLKQYVTGSQPHSQLPSMHDRNPRSASVGRGGFGTVGPSLTRTP